MATLNELLARRAEIEEQIAQTQQKERADAIARVKHLMAEHGLSIADLASSREVRGRTGKTSSVAPKYRNHATGETWSGRGLQPRWLKAALAGGASLETFKL